MPLSKTAGNGAKKNIPCDYHGVFNIPGGARNLLPLAYERPASKTQKNKKKYLFILAGDTTPFLTHFSLCDYRNKIVYKNYVYDNISNS